MWGTLGRISVAVMDSAAPAAPAGWRDVGSFEEAGPIATDVQLIPIGSVSGDTVRIRLTMARGSWRLGYAALATLGDERVATLLEPTAVAGPHPQTGDYLITYPGEQYRFTYTLPRAAPSYALFIRSRGYYYEWMRGEWLADENPQLIALFGLDPRAALRTLAPRFKAAERGFDENFWASRFGQVERR